MRYKPERALTPQPPVPVPGKKTLVPDSASSEGRAIRQVEILSNKLLTTAFEASIECVTVICC